MAKTLVLAEKPSVGKELARVLGCRRGGEGCLEGERYIVTWALGHLVELAPPEAYDKAWEKWDLLTLPMLPDAPEGSLRTHERAPRSAVTCPYWGRCLHFPTWTRPVL